ncbi:MAG: VanZ family protein [Thermoanaerobaculaceae bacterium]|jgi:VanZ family protein|nr:VanZ family protein [Thermoanaerobaculaceae bacterium]
MSPLTGRRAAIVWLVATLTVSCAFMLVGSRPSVPRALRELSDLILHAGAYLVLAVLAARTARSFRWPVPLVLGLVYAVVHGAGLEILQYFNPPRAAEWSDWVADCAGAGVGVLVLGWWERVWT